MVLAQLSWGAFKKKVMDKYCNERALDRIEDEFRNLKKGDKPIDKYSRFFVEKLSFVGHLIPDEKAIIKAYQKGLPAEIKTAVRNAKVTTHQEAIEESQLVEDDLVQGKEEKARVGEKRRWESRSGPLQRPRPFVGNLRAEPHREPNWCPKCKSKHFVPCRVTSGECFKCGKSGHTIKDCPIRGMTCYECKETGHYRKDCPKLKTGGNQGRKDNPPKATRRAFRMSTEEAKASTDVVSGTFLVNSVPACTLFDSGANLSFVSQSFSHKLLTPTSTLSVALVVEVENVCQVLVHDVLKGYAISLGRK
ncbi:hypothetical protein L6452_40288 [Arctium lappa]|uniref:Uncharacterized protein n=1 Tax=Arctium lappa TaxID=4217 RepID=A0ACB8XLI5_ARCLA|nr:hypothetical protein L6452_40288 [Arctium lappa]